MPFFSSSRRSKRSTKERRRSAAMPPTSFVGAATELSVMNSSSPETTCWAHHSQSDRQGHLSANVPANFSVRPCPAQKQAQADSRRSVVGARLSGRERLLLLDRRFRLMLGLPLLVRHAVDDLAGVVVAHLQALVLG